MPAPFPEEVFTGRSLPTRPCTRLKPRCDNSGTSLDANAAHSGRDGTTPPWSPLLRLPPIVALSFLLRGLCFFAPSPSNLSSLLPHAGSRKDQGSAEVTGSGLDFLFYNPASAAIVLRSSLLKNFARDFSSRVWLPEIVSNAPLAPGFRNYSLRVAKSKPVRPAFNDEHSQRAVTTALWCNFLVFSLKFGVWLATSSHVMLAEVVHSVADFANQALLASGLNSSRRVPDATHPYGYSKERFVWSLIFAVGIFCLSSGATVAHGLQNLSKSHSPKNIHYAALVIGGSFQIEDFLLSEMDRGGEMKTSEKKMICYTSRKSSIVGKDARPKLDSESIKKNFHKVSYKKKCRLKPNTLLKKRRVRKNFSNGHVESVQKSTHHSSVSGKSLSKLSTNESSCAWNKENFEMASKSAERNLHKRKKWKRKRKVVDSDEASRLQRRTRYLLIKMKLEQNLIDAYSGDGWNGQSREKIKPEKELQRAEKQIVKCKLGIRDAICQLDSLSCVGGIANPLMHPDGSIFHEHIFCAKCRSNKAFRDNDIVLCDGTCNRGFHQRCLEPPLEKIPPGDQAWFCKFCTCKLEILETINAHLGTCFSVNSSWEDIFKEAIACSDVENTYPNPTEEWPSDDSEDEDYNPEQNENSKNALGIEEDDSDSLSSFFCSSDGAISHSDLEYYSCGKEYRSKKKADLLDSIDKFDFGESNECEITNYRRQRRDVDYKKLHDEMFGKEPPENEAQSEDEDWGPNNRKRRRVEASIGNCIANPVNVDGRSNMGLTEKASTDRKRQIFRIPAVAVEKLRVAFSENELPSRSVRENLSKQLGIASEKVSKWFKNARYAALKLRKNETVSTMKSRSSSVEINGSLLKDFGQLDYRARRPFKQFNDRTRFIQERTVKKWRKDHQKDEKNDTEQYLTEFERMSRLEDKIRSLKKALLSCSDENGITNKSCVEEQTVIYVPVAEVKEKA